MNTHVILGAASLALLLLLHSCVSAADPISLHKVQAPTIAYGSYADRGEFPAMVAIQVTATQRQFCAGSLIDPYYVLTAAHCFDYGRSSAPQNFHLVFDRVNLLDSSQGFTRQIHNITMHPGWTQGSTTNENDMAIIRLTEPVFKGNTSNYFIQYATVNPGDYSLGTVLFVIGYGATESQSRSYQLKKTTVPLTPLASCAPYGYVNSDMMLCAGTASVTDACIGDSGGPLLQKQNDGTFAVIGLVSWGQPVCGAAPSYGGYTRVSYFYNWIRTIVPSVPEVAPEVSNNGVTSQALSIHATDPSIATLLQILTPFLLALVFAIMP